MEVQNFRAKNFRNLKDVLIGNFGKINFFLGLNNSGKSSIKGAMCYALTGSSEWTESGKGLKEKELVRHGTDEASARIEVKGLGNVERRIGQKTNTCKLNGHTIPDREVEKELVREYGVGYLPLVCQYDSTKFVTGMTKDEQKAFLFALTKASMDPDTLVSFMDKPSDRAKETVLKALPPSVGIKDIDTAYKLFYANRAAEKKVLASDKAKNEVLGNISEKSGIVIDKVRQEIQSLLKQKEELTGKIAVINEKAEQKRKLSEGLQKISQKIEEIKKQVDPAVDLSDADEVIFSLITEINDYKTEVEKARVREQVLASQNKSLRHMVTNLGTKTCPLSDKLICKTDKGPLTKELLGQIATNEENIRLAQKDNKDALEKLNKVQAQKDRIDKQLKLDIELNSLTEQKESLEKDLEGIKVEDKAELEKQVAEITQKMQGLKDQETAHSEWEKKRKEKDGLKVKLQAAEETVALYEYLVKEFSPKGVKARILKQIITPLENYLNERLAQLTDGYQVRFDMDDDFDIFVKTQSGESRLKGLSTSEKLRLGIVFQDTVNNLTGAKILVVDNMDILDDKNTDLFLSLLGKIADRYDSIFAFTTTSDTKIASVLKKINGSKVFFVKEGQVSEI